MTRTTSRPTLIMRSRLTPGPRDVALTVGSDVAVVQSPGSSVGPAGAKDLAGAVGVKAVAPELTTGDTSTSS